MKIDWIRTIRNFVLFAVLAYTVASVYFISTNRTEFNEYKEYNMNRELLKEADIVDVFLVAFDANTEDVNKRKRNAKIAAVKSYVTFAFGCIKMEINNRNRKVNLTEEELKRNQAAFLANAE